MSNYQFQIDFVNSITTSSSNEGVLSNIIPVGKLSAEEVLNVYRQDYNARLTEAIGESFESIWAVVGDEEFFNLCKEFISLNKSAEKELGKYTQNFCAFLEKHPMLEEFPFLYELAKFEYCFWRMFHTKSDLNVCEFTNDFFEKKFIFTNNIQLFQWDYRIFDIWKNRKTGFAEIEVDTDKEQFLVLFKNSHFVQGFELTKAQYTLLEKLMQGHKLVQILDDFEIEESQMMQLFQFLAANNLVKDFVD